MIKRILSGLAAIALVTAVTLPALALETPEERRAHKREEARKYPEVADEAMKKQDYDKAIEFYTKSIESGAFKDQPEYTGKLYFARGVAYRGKHDCPSALNDFTKAAETINMGDLFYSMAACHLELKQDDLALADLDKAVKVDPDAINYREARCKVLFNKHDFAGAIPDCEKALGAKPDDKDLLTAGAQAEEQVGNKAKASEFYRKLLSVDPGNTVAAEGVKRTGG